MVRRPVSPIPWTAARGLDEALVLGRQTLTLMACGLLAGAGHLVGLPELGYHGAWATFHLGALWVSFVELDD